MYKVTTPEGAMIFGGDYNPEQWPETTWQEDMEFFRAAGVNEVTINVFAWAALQPTSSVYDFARLDRIVQTVSDAGQSIVMGPSTASIPPWLSLMHPEVNRVDLQGIRLRHRTRHNACINSPVFRHLSTASPRRSLSATQVSPIWSLGTSRTSMEASAGATTAPQASGAG